MNISMIKDSTTLKVIRNFILNYNPKKVWKALIYYRRTTEKVVII